MFSYRTGRAFYCSNKCRQRAWRARRKSRLEQEANQIDAISWEIYQAVIRRRPDLEQELDPDPTWQQWSWENIPCETAFAYSPGYSAYGQTEGADSDKGKERADL